MAVHDLFVALSSVLDSIVPYILYALSLGVGCHVDFKDLRAAVRNLPALGIYVIAFYVVGPGSWFLLLRALQVPAKYAWAFLVVSNSPGGLFGNVLTVWANGDVNLSIGCTIVGLIVCLVSWAPCSQFWGSAYAADGVDSVSIPIEAFAKQCFACLVPIFGGMLCRQYFSRIAYWLRRIVGLMVIVVLTAFMVSFLAVKLPLLKAMPGSVWVMGTVCPLASLPVYVVARICPVCQNGKLVCGLKHAQALPLMFEFTIKNIGLALAVALASFPREQADVFITAITAMSVGLNLVLFTGLVLSRVRAVVHATGPTAELLGVEDGSPSSSQPPVPRERSLYWGTTRVRESQEASLVAASAPVTECAEEAGKAGVSR